MARVVVVGSCNCDLTIRVDHLPGVGETVSDGEFLQCFGGKGANQALAACLAGAEVGFACKLGRDSFGDNYRQALISFGIDPVGLLQDDSLPTGVALILVDRTGKNQIAVAPGANRHLLPQDILSLRDVLIHGQVLLVQLEIPLETVHFVLEVAKDRGMTTVLDPAPARPLPSEILSLVDLITPNEMEVEHLTGLRAKDLQEVDLACQHLLSLGVKGAIVTLADQGAFLYSEDQRKHFPAYTVPGVDSTAAGDAFNGTLACALAEGKSLPEAVAWANAAGALATTKLGAQPSLPSRSEIEALFCMREIKEKN